MSGRVEQDVALAIKQPTSAKARVESDLVLALKQPTSSKARVEQDVLIAIKQPTSAKARVQQDVLLVIVSNNRLRQLNVKRPISRQRRPHTKHSFNLHSVGFRFPPSAIIGPNYMIAGSLVDPTGNGVAGTITFQLQNLQGQIPNTQKAACEVVELQATAVVANDGSFTVRLWGNDQVVPKGTFYSAQFIAVDGDRMSLGAFACIGGGVHNISTVPRS